MSAASDASDRRGADGRELVIAGPRTGDEWLRTRPLEEQLAEYDRREAEDLADALRETQGRNRVVRWWRVLLVRQRANHGRPYDRTYGG